MALTPDTDQFSQFLRLAFLRSPNYAAGVSGWTINQDGSVEFNNGTFRGSIVGGALFIYSGAPGLGNPPQLAIVPGTTTQDPYGNAVTSSKILMQNNVITASAGIFRTAAAAPLIQLDGSHDAILIYDASSHLTETVTPAQTTDGLGNTVYAGFSAYSTLGPIIAQLLAGQLNIGTAAQIGLTSGKSPALLRLLGSTEGTLIIASGLNGTGDIAAQVAFLSQNAGGGNQPLIQFQDPLQIVDTSTVPATSALGAQPFSIGGQLRVVDASDGNTYGTERQLAQVSPRSQSITSITGVNIGGLSIPVVNGRTYIVRCRIIIEWNSNASTPLMRFAGPAISQFDVSFKSQQSGTTSTANDNNLVSAGTVNGTGYNGTFVQVTNAQTVAGIFFDMDIWGMFTFSASGTLTLQAATPAAVNPWIVLSGFWEVLPL